ncbi:MAG: mechanosensitive ion channel family protein [Moraxellaceae bacterium]|nr:mechanosensitive ion channel family protein [Pseudomonadales bacterium]MCP5175626.1 mechanosensitive ion channel family protein [Moraxellaceae bacterium]MCP5177774.1 mechanosensitive ion channel family protein [Moraxellaceae bacterium]
MAKTPDTFLDRLINLPVNDKIEGFIIGGVILILGYFVARLVSSTFVATIGQRLSPHQLLVWRRSIFYFLLLLFTVSGLHEMGFKIGVLLGAAGIFTVAIGFASQTSVSNLISGLFLIGEGSFEVGDFISVNNVTGEVLSIDLLSIKLRTIDNIYVRIPNEQLIKAELLNLTRFPIRRIPISLSISYKEDISKVRALLIEQADKHPLVLEEPRPQVIVQDFANSAINLSFNIWTRKENVIELRGSMQEVIKHAFDEHRIEIPFPQITINSGELAPLSLNIQPSVTQKHETKPT